MLTVDTLSLCGVDTDDGIKRCAGMTDFYLSLVKSVLSMDKLLDLEEKIASGDCKAAFESAHAMKGMYANLSLTPVSVPVAEMTERLRAGDMSDCTGLLSDAKKHMQELIALLD